MDAIFRRTFPAPDDLGGFLAHLPTGGEVLAMDEPVCTVLDATEIHRRVIAAGGPVLRFNRPVKADGRTSNIPLVVNLFGTAARVAAGFGIQPEQLPALGAFLADLRQPAPVRGMRDAM